MRTRPEGVLQQMEYCIHSIPCECVRHYTGETDILLAAWLRKQTQSKRGLLEKSELAQHVYQGYRVCWHKARILENESNSKCRKYTESAHIAHLTNLSRQPSLHISPIWILLISNEASNS
jgi:hypothetical protein